MPGIRIGMTTTSVNTREVGYSTKYAPSTAAIAPLAPSIGTLAEAAEPASSVTAVWVAQATKPPAT